MILNKIEETSFIFKENHVFIEVEDNPSENFVRVEEELNGIDIDDIGNLEDLPSVVTINEKCENLKVVVVLCGQILVGR